MRGRILLALFCTLMVALFSLSIIHPAFSETDTSDASLENINKQISDLTDALNKSIAATKPLESELTSMQQRIENIKQEVTVVERNTVIKDKEIQKGYKNLADKEKLLSKTIREFYVQSYYDSPLLIFFSTGSASQITQSLAYQKAKTNQEKALITNLALSIGDLEKKKVKLEQEKKWLIATKANLDKQSAKLDETIKGAKDYQKDVSGKIAELNEKQKEILNAKSGFTVSIQGAQLAGDPASSHETFVNSAPAGSFAIFSFGAYTHRNGMSQYGAYGRANKGQSYKDILKAYYGKEPTSVDTGGTIKVAGNGEISFEDQYLLGIAEMPSTWPAEALKSQAIAARTYAYRYKQDNKEICTTEACQVYSASKAASPPDAWKQAVQDTKGQILDGVVTYFSSTAGGWINGMGWDTFDGAGGPNFIDKTYEKEGGSPWLYRAWFKKGYTNEGDTCGRANPWLSSVEMADIVNAYLVLTKGSSDEAGRISPVTTSCWGGNPYSIDELRSVASKYGGISSAGSASVALGNGVTNSVTINGISINGADFQKAFNLRAPGYIRIPQTGFAFFNIESK